MSLAGRKGEAAEGEDVVPLAAAWRILREPRVENTERANVTVLCAKAQRFGMPETRLQVRTPQLCDLEHVIQPF